MSMQSAPPLLDRFSWMRRPIHQLKMGPDVDVQDPFCHILWEHLGFRITLFGSIDISHLAQVEQRLQKLQGICIGLIRVIPV